MNSEIKRLAQSWHTGPLLMSGSNVLPIWQMNSSMPLKWVISESVHLTLVSPEFVSFAFFFFPLVGFLPADLHDFFICSGNFILCQVCCKYLPPDQLWLLCHLSDRKTLKWMYLQRYHFIYAICLSFLKYLSFPEEHKYSLKYFLWSFWFLQLQPYFIWNLTELTPCGHIISCPHIPLICERGSGWEHEALSQPTWFKSWRHL